MVKNSDIASIIDISLFKTKYPPINQFTTTTSNTEYYNIDNYVNDFVLFHRHLQYNYLLLLYNQDLRLKL